MLKPHEIAGALDAHLKAAGVPLVGVSIGKPDEKDTWVAYLLPTATAAQHATAESLIRQFDPATVPTPVPDPSLSDLVQYVGYLAGKTIDETKAEIAAVVAGGKP